MMAAGSSSSYKMETDVFCNSAAADAGTATSKTLIKCTQLPFLGEHPLHTTNCSTPCNNGLEQIQIGYFYELNHQNLPRRSPIHLKSIRVVMVTETTDYNVAVKFPSSSSLRTYFRRVFRNENKQGKNQTVGTTSITPPKLDEEFVMGSKPARDVLARQILPSEFSQRKKLESFWLVEPPKDESNEEEPIISSSTSSPMVEIPVTEEGGGRGWGDKSVKKGSSSSSSILSAGLMRWGVRRRVTFVGKHKEITDPAEPVVDGQSSLMEPAGIKSEDEEEDEEAAVEAGLMEEDSTDEKRMRTRKRTREISLRSRKKAKTTKEREKIKGKRSRRKNKSKKVSSSAGVSIKKKISTAGKSIKKKVAGEEGKDKLSYDRWSKERYKTAEGRMLDILKETKAVFGQPILRRDLRLEARKHIGDTGLLDHLLKHMAGKVAPNGEDRFRRRHNSEGEMEYWLESADLVNVRKEAGVNDPYWTPPPGWKLGDNPSQHPVCAKEVMLIREEMADLKRNMEELLVLKSSMSCITNKEATVHVAGSLEGGQGNLIQQLPVAALMSSSSNNNLSPTIATVGVVAPLKGMYESLVEKKAQLEQQLVEISVSLNQMQKEVGKITSTALVEETTKSSVLVEASAAERTEAAAAAVDDKEEEEEEKRRGSSLVVLKREGDDPILPEDDREKELNEAEKAAKRQRIRSGFRICKPQGTFLWPNMVGGGGTTPGSTSTATAAAAAAAAGTGCSNNILALSPREHGGGGVGGHGHHQHQHPQVMVQVQEDLNMVPTPSSVNSSSSASHCLQLQTTTAGGGGPRSPLMKPLAERRAVTVTVVVPDLNDDAIAYEDGDNKNNISTTTTTTTTTSYLHHGHGHGPYGHHHHGTTNTNTNSRKEFYGTTTTPTSSLSADQAFVLPPSHQQQQQQQQQQEQQVWGRGEKQIVQSEATAAAARRSNELVQYHRKQHQHQQQLQQHIDMGLGMGIYGQDYNNGYF